MRVAAVQFDIVWEDKPANHALIEKMLDEARIDPGTLVLLPELGDTGFSFDLDRIVDDRTLPWAADLARRRGIWLQAGYARRGPEEGKGRNCASLIDPQGGVVGTYEKVHPFTYGREADHYLGGDHLVVASIDGVAVAPMICYDLRFPELWRLAAAGGAEVFTIGASWPDTRQEHWRALAVARAIENQAYVVAVNRIGVDPHFSYAGGSLIVSPRGEILAEATGTAIVLQGDLDLDALRGWRADFPALRDIHADLLGSIRMHTTITKKDARPATQKAAEE